ncbi:hypothetical protein GOB94_09135 [Granulicella sp. 5B5]|uniref:hypothetical protein n=1 Tax=Granulicella sp. 5B5 TaxID=1617967 RepID=UPI0015F54ACD|nr:hypothetical protein [Granulicella sp. 5B5]QMV18828.1 hypothetical protein GOB94_09135 [Granulicella sp. 5B5]
MYLVRKPVCRVEAEPELREGSTGQIVGRRATAVTLERVWAVAAADVPPEAAAKPEAKPAVELAFYRKYTEALLRRYLRLSMQAGRVPSLMSREIFRGHVTHYRVHGLEDVVIFCHDVEQRLARLNYTEQQLIKRLILQQYTRGEAAGMLGMSLSHLLKRYAQAVDRLTGLLLEAGLLNPLEP